MATTTSNWGSGARLDYAHLETGRDAFSKLTLSTTEAQIIGEEDLDLERQLFASRGSGAGDSLAALELSVTVEGPEQIVPCARFKDSELHATVLSNIQKCGYEKPTAIQAYCIPAVLSGKDIVAVAQTGSGKTAAYLCPIVSKLMGKVDQIGGPRADVTATNYDPELHKVRAEPLVIIVCPTRELALQIYEETRRIAYRSKLRAACAYGGIPIKYNLQQLGKGCDILIGTPGRLIDMLERPNVISLARVRFTVIDEADEMLQDSEWEEALGKIMAGGDANEDADHRYLMFSATFPKEARKLARQYLQEDYVRIRVGRAGSSHRNVQQQIIWVDEDAKQTALADMLAATEPSLIIIFCNSVPGVERLDDFLFNKGYPTGFLHGRRSQFEREDTMRAFFLRKHPILITTGLTARGIDFAGVSLVVNYDLPSTEHGGIDEYIHRIGRTGRIGHVGKAVSFYNERNEGIGESLVNVLLETDQEVPDFLVQYKPDDGKAVFQDDSEEDDEAGVDNGGGGGWSGAATDNGWGAEASQTIEDVNASSDAHSGAGGGWNGVATNGTVEDGAW
ncbi:DEAD-domain-containing protein [Myriangium duriaei CBS 260.36]|uniref:RNA helicase n=1 Tax=Myriangium duriaei CBS 260.36 TaxID=1168546 RepID=A0A9P4MHW4_9PEZI|nr:DEAD-domain-containing protein [Myriangium duriaei CBS 260.36]